MDFRIGWRYSRKDCQEFDINGDVGFRCIPIFQDLAKFSWTQPDGALCVVGHDPWTREDDRRLNPQRSFQLGHRQKHSSHSQVSTMENYSGLLPFLWKTFKKPQERKPAPEMEPLSLHDNFENRDDGTMHQDDEYFLHPALAMKSPARGPKSPGMFGRSPGRSHKRRHSTGLSSFSLPKLLSLHSQRARWEPISLTLVQAKKTLG